MSNTTTNFIGALNQTIANQSRILTENGAVSLATTGKSLLDFNYAVPSMRNIGEDDIMAKFGLVYAEDPDLAIKYMFMVRDVRGGMGERRLFRVLLKFFAANHPCDLRRYLPIVPEYGRWDDLMSLVDTDLQDDVIKIVKEQLGKDFDNLQAGKSISLLAKWLPSINTSSQATVLLAKKIARELNMTDRQYRKMLSMMRGKIKIVEGQMSASEWGEIEYSAVPSKANLIYSKAFLRHDEERRKAFIEDLKKGKTTINSSTCYPHDIVHRYATEGGYRVNNDVLEEMWKALPYRENISKPVIVVSDGSGSMTTKVSSSSSVSAMEVAQALSVFFSECLTGPYKDKFITFSMNPRYVDLSNCSSLHEKLFIASRCCEVANTNIEKVFKMILDTAVNNSVPQEEIPDILIISDMEFDECVVEGKTKSTGAYDWGSALEPTSFEKFAEQYRDKGYDLPKVIFWNVASRTNAIPMSQNKFGCALVSGFSQSNIDMVMSEKLDPYEILVDKLNTQRYDLDKMLSEVLNRK